MLQLIGGGAVSQTVTAILRKTDGTLYTGLTNATSGLFIAIRADNESSFTQYTVAAGNVEDITALGTYQAPSAGKVRFKEISSSVAPGAYEVHFADARWAVAGAVYSVITVGGAADIAQEYGLTQHNVVSATDVQTACDAAIEARSPALATAADITAVRDDISSQTAHGDSTWATATTTELGSTSHDALVAAMSGDFQSGVEALRISILNYFRVLLRSDSALATDLGDVLTEINEDLASGAGDYANTADSVEAIRDRGDTAWITAVLTGLALESTVGAVQAETDKLVDLFRLALRGDAALATDLAALITEINADLGSGAGTFDNASDANETLGTKIADIDTETTDLAQVTDAQLNGGLSEPTSDVTTASALLVLTQATWKLLKNLQTKDDTGSPTVFEVMNNDGETVWLTADKSTSAGVTTRTEFTTPP